MTTAINPIGLALNEAIERHALSAVDAIYKARREHGTDTEAPRAFTPVTQVVTWDDFDSLVMPILEFAEHYYFTTSTRVRQPDGSIHWSGLITEPYRLLMEEVAFPTDQQVREFTQFASGTMRAYGFAEQIEGGPRGGRFKIRPTKLQCGGSSPIWVPRAVYYEGSVPEKTERSVTPRLTPVTTITAPQMTENDVTSFLRFVSARADQVADEFEALRKERSEAVARVERLRLFLAQDA